MIKFRLACLLLLCSAIGKPQTSTISDTFSDLLYGQSFAVADMVKSCQKQAIPKNFWQDFTI